MVAVDVSRTRESSGRRDRKRKKIARPLLETWVVRYHDRVAGMDIDPSIPVTKCVYLVVVVRCASITDISGSSLEREWNERMVIVYKSTIGGFRFANNTTTSGRVSGLNKERRQLVKLKRMEGGIMSGSKR